jgi:hypothetical protein
MLQQHAIAADDSPDGEWVCHPSARAKNKLASVEGFYRRNSFLMPHPAQKEVNMPVRSAVLIIFHEGLRTRPDRSMVDTNVRKRTFFPFLPMAKGLIVRKGSKYGLWYGNHVYALEPQSAAAQFAAANVRIVGSLSKDVISIESIAPIPATQVPKTQR